MTALGDAPPLAWERLLEAGEIDERLVLTSAEEARAAASAAHRRTWLRSSSRRSRERESSAPTRISSTRWPPRGPAT